MFKLEPLLPYSTSESAQFFHPIYLDDFLVILSDITAQKQAEQVQEILYFSNP